MYFALQVIRKGEVSCCWICTACKENEFVQDEFTCKACELGWWPNADLTGRDMAQGEWCVVESKVATCRDIKGTYLNTHPNAV